MATSGTDLREVLRRKSAAAAGSNFSNADSVGAEANDVQRTQQLTNTGADAGRSSARQRGTSTMLPPSATARSRPTTTALAAGAGASSPIPLINGKKYGGSRSATSNTMTTTSTTSTPAVSGTAAVDLACARLVTHLHAVPQLAVTCSQLLARRNKTVSVAHTSVLDRLSARGRFLRFRQAVRVGHQQILDGSGGEGGVCADSGGGIGEPDGTTTSAASTTSSSSCLLYTSPSPRDRG